MTESDSSSSHAGDSPSPGDALLGAGSDSTAGQPIAPAAETRPLQRYSELAFTEKYVLEVIFLLFVFPNNLLGTPITDLFMQKACLYELGFNATVCDDFKNNDSIQKQVQDVSNYYSTMKNIVSTLPGEFRFPNGTLEIMPITASQRSLSNKRIEYLKEPRYPSLLVNTCLVTA